MPYLARNAAVAAEGMPEILIRPSLQRVLRSWTIPMWRSKPAIRLRY